jgi:hypothetical protein
MKLYTYPGSPVCRPIGWYRRMQDLPNWRSANAALDAWADMTRGRDYVSA